MQAIEREPRPLWPSLAPSSVPSIRARPETPSAAHGGLPGIDALTVDWAAPRSGHRHELTLGVAAGGRFAKLSTVLSRPQSHLNQTRRTHQTGWRGPR